MCVIIAHVQSLKQARPRRYYTWQRCVETTAMSTEGPPVTAEAGAGRERADSGHHVAGSNSRAVLFLPS